MDIICQLSVIAIISTFTVGYFVYEKPIRRLLNKRFPTTIDSVSYESAKKALEHISSWTIWITGLQTAAIAAMGLLIKDHKPESWLLAFCCIVFFGFSIILSTLLLCAVPSLQMRLKESAVPENDIYTKNIFTGFPVSLQHVSALVHIYFVIGLILFAFFIFTYNGYAAAPPVKPI